MKTDCCRSQILSYFYLFTACVCFIILAGCGKEKSTQESSQYVKVFKVEDRKEAVYTYTALTRAAKRAELSFEVDGILIEVLVKSGDTVQANQILAKLDPKEFQYGVDQAKSKYEAAEADLKRNAAMLEKEYISKSYYDRFIVVRDTAKAEYDTALKRLNDTIMRAPFAGIIASKPLDNFQTVRANQPIMSLQDMSNMEIVLNVPSKDLVLKKGDPKDLDIEVAFEDVPGKKFKAQLFSFATVADPKTQTYEVVLMMPSPEGINLLPGMSGKVTVKRAIDEQATQHGHYVIPISAIVGDINGMPSVWVVDTQTHRVLKRSIKIGKLSNDWIEVTEGLSAGDVIVELGANKMIDGMTVHY